MKYQKAILLLFLIFGCIIRLFWVFFNNADSFPLIEDEILAFKNAIQINSANYNEFHLSSRLPLENVFLPGYIQNFYYALLFLIYPHPILPIVIIALIGSFAPIFTYKIAIIFCKNRNIAILSFILHAISPWTIIFSIGIWNIYYLEILIPIIILCFLRFMQKRKPFYIYLLAVLIAITLQFHLIMIYILPVFILHLLYFKIRIRIKEILIIVMIFFIFYIPYLYKDFENDFENTKAILFPYQEEYWETESLKIFYSPIIIASSEISRYISNNQFSINEYDIDEFMSKSNDGFKRVISFYNKYFIHYVFGFLILLFCLFISTASIIMLFYQCFKKMFFILLALIKHNHNFNINQRSFLLTCLIVIPILLFLISGKSFSLRYAIIWFPFIFMFLALFFRYLYRKFKFKKTVIIIVLIFILNNIYTIVAYNYDSYIYKNNANYPLANIITLDRISDVLKEDANGNSFEIIYDDLSTIKHVRSFALLKLFIYIKHNIKNDPISPLEYHIISSFKINKDDRIIFKTKSYCIIKKYNLEKEKFYSLF